MQAPEAAKSQTLINCISSHVVMSQLLSVWLINMMSCDNVNRCSVASTRDPIRKRRLWLKPTCKADGSFHGEEVGQLPLATMPCYDKKMTNQAKHSFRPMQAPIAAKSQPQSFHGGPGNPRRQAPMKEPVLRLLPNPQLQQ